MRYRPGLSVRALLTASLLALTSCSGGGSSGPQTWSKLELALADPMHELQARTDPRVAGLRHNETPRIVWRTSCEPMFKELLYVMLAEIEREGIDSKIPETEIESRGYARPCTDRRWKVGAAGHLGFPPSWIREILEMFAGGDLSLLAHLGRNRGAI